MTIPERLDTLRATLRHQSGMSRWLLSAIFDQALTYEIATMRLRDPKPVSAGPRPPAPAARIEPCVGVATVQRGAAFLPPKDAEIAQLRQGGIGSRGKARPGQISERVFNVRW